MKGRQNDKTKGSPNVMRSFSFFDFKLMTLLLVFILIAVPIVSSFYRLQITEHEVLAAKAASQQFVTQTDLPRRGMILDRNGYPLVMSSYVYRVGMTPGDVSSKSKDIDEADIVEKVGFYLGLESDVCDSLLEKIRADRASGWTGFKKNYTGHEPVLYVSIASEVPENQAMRLKDWLSANRVGGFRFDAEERRVYNNGNLASSVLGLTRMEDGKVTGVSGLEAAYDDLLSGKSGYTFAKRNNYSTQGLIPFSEPVSRPAEKGYDLVSTLDIEVMTILQEELASIAAAAGLIEGVHGLVMEVKTGNILAMGQISSFDASDPTAVPIGFTVEDWSLFSAEEKTAYLSSKLWNNVNITDVYEPGSVFKAITLAIGLEEGAAWEGSMFNDDPIVIQGEEISCYSVHGHGDETLREAFYLSCNPVFVHLGNRLGKDLYYEWIKKLGFYGKTGIDLPMEASGLLHTSPMQIDFANLTFGESSSLTAIQLARLFAALGNGGYTVVPRVGYASTDGGLDAMEAFPVEEGTRVFSNETCRRVRSMMADVVERGTATGTFGAMGFDLGGKTGTAIHGNTEERTFSFVGLAPIDDPEYVVLVSIHKPVTGITLSSSAARAANRVAARLLNLDGKEQHYSSDELAYLSRPVSLPDLSGYSLAEASLELLKLNLSPVVPLDTFFLDQAAVRMVPEAGSLVGRGSTVWLYPEEENEVEWVAVPDFGGCNYHEAIWLAAEYGVTIIAGDLPQGPVQSQDTAPTSASGSDDQSGSPGGSDLAPPGKVRRGHCVTVYFSKPGSGD